MSTLPDHLPLSFLNQLCYCPRRFWLMFYQSEMEINAPVLEGQLRHKTADTPGYRTDEQGRILRSVHVWSDTLRIAGIADFVQERDDTLIPLEERIGRLVPYGEIFYWTNRRREQVLFDDELRERTRATVERAFNLLEMGRLPAPIEQQAKCTDCSLEPICLPRETRRLYQENMR